MAIRSFLLFFLSFSFASPTFLQAQAADSLYEIYRSIPLEGRYLTSDKLQQFYVITPDNELIKYNPAGVEVFRYNNNYLGKLDRIDVSNPFHLILYYPDYSTILTLDRTLSVTGTISLFDLGIRNTGAVGLAFDNNLWIYDEVDYRVRKYNDNGEVLVESDDLGSILLSQQIEPVSITEQNNRLYLNDPEVGIFVFDIFGQYLSTIPLQGVWEFQIRDQLLFYQSGTRFFVWQMDAKVRRPVSTPLQLKAGEQLRLEQNCFYFLGEQGIKIFRKKGI